MNLFIWFSILIWTSCPDGPTWSNSIEHDQKNILYSWQFGTKLVTSGFDWFDQIAHAANTLFYQKRSGVHVTDCQNIYGLMMWHEREIWDTIERFRWDFVCKNPCDVWDQITTSLSASIHYMLNRVDVLGLYYGYVIESIVLCRM